MNDARPARPHPLLAWAPIALTLTFAAACVAHVAGLYWPRVEVETSAPQADKWAHLVGFAVPVALGWLRWGSRRVRGWLVVAFAAHAVVSELVQGVLPQRAADPCDTLADLLGVVLGVLLGGVLSGSVVAGVVRPLGSRGRPALSEAVRRVGP